jgi:hypothetical protein
MLLRRRERGREKTFRSHFLMSHDSNVRDAYETTLPSLLLMLLGRRERAREKTSTSIITNNGKKAREG